LFVFVHYYYFSNLINFKKLALLIRRKIMLGQQKKIDVSSGLIIVGRPMAMLAAIPSRPVMIGSSDSGFKLCSVIAGKNYTGFQDLI